ncbi:hypothetical protein, partial [Burkholderia sp. Ax-1720]|uniref:hypothetical protein n=1 Tax=Burkholderia sp. Ax-1720 TaxID=2608335 RepID=UPI001964EC36
VEPVLISLFFLQIVSGLLLLLPKLEMAQDRFGNLQTATGAYLGWVYLTVTAPRRRRSSWSTCARISATTCSACWATTRIGT